MHITNQSIKVVHSHYDMFEKVIVVNDKSKDDTQITSRIRTFRKLIVLNNKKNVGAGKSFEVGIKEFLKLNVTM